MRRGERALPLEHTAVNLALYRGGRQVTWVMSEYQGAGALDDGHIAVGGAELERDAAGGALIAIADRTTPFMTMVTGPLGRRVEGEILIEPLCGPMAPCTIAGQSGSRPHIHTWQALAPRARVRARFRHPDHAHVGELSFDSDGYFDRNHGDGRLEDAFARWGWARFHGEGATTVLYACEGRGGERRVLGARSADGDSGVCPVELTPLAEGAPRRAGWGLRIPSRFGGAELSCAPTFLLERSPFYSRYGARLEGSQAGGGATVGLGEWLDLDRFRSRWHQFLLRFKTRT